MHETVYPPRVAFAAAGLRNTTVLMWQRTGLLRNFDSQAVSRGMTRFYSRADVLALALIRLAGGGERHMADLAPMVAEDYLAGHAVERVHVFYAANGVCVGWSYHHAGAPAVWATKREYNVAPVFRETLEALELAAANARRKPREGFAVVDAAELAAEPDPGQFRVIRG